MPWRGMSLEFIVLLLGIADIRCGRIAMEMGILLGALAHRISLAEGYAKTDARAPESRSFT